MIDIAILVEIPRNLLLQSIDNLLGRSSDLKPLHIGKSHVLLNLKIFKQARTAAEYERVEDD